MRARILLLPALAVTITILTGCQRPQAKLQYDKPLPPGELALRKITNPEEIPDFTDACHNVTGLARAVDNSLNYLSKPSSKRYFPYADITHARAVDSLKAFKKLIASGLRGRELNSAIAQQFDVYISVGCDYAGTVLFTGYYTPIFDGSPSRSARFTYPLYRKPEDLVKNSEGDILGRRSGDGQITPYPARADIETSNMLAGKEVVYLAEAFEVYVAHVQGSAKIKMPDGRLVTYGYAANNGHEYKSVGRELVSRGKIPADRLSLSSMFDYFNANPMLVRMYTRLNPRFVFFQRQQGPPRGSLNEPVIPYRTIATDKSIYPRASLTFFTTNLPRKIAGRIYIDPYRGFALDQDTGGAIRAPGRCDVYIGQGDTAGNLAGHTYQEGRLYYLFLKPQYRTTRGTLASAKAR